MSLVAFLKPKGPTGFGYGSTAEQVTEGLSLAGKNILVTGCNSGLGEETLRVLALRGARVLAAARSREKARETIARVASAVSTPALPFECELSEPESVKRCVQEIQAQRQRLDAIVCNAGIMALPKRELVHGYERQFFTNHMGHFLLVTGLLEQLSDTGRVVMVSSAAHQMAPRGAIAWGQLKDEGKYSAWGFYGQSKMANLLFAKSLARRFEGTSRVAMAIHPGVIQTNLGRHMSSIERGAMSLVNPLFLKSIPQGAATQVFGAVHPKAATFSGEYLADCNRARCRGDARDPAIADRLWQI
jgi:NAD(P)-dependent dehydrogenase (short-subunit alcohol dehydrogenase family)